MKKSSYSKGHVLEMLPIQFSIIRKHGLQFYIDVVKTTWIWFSSILGLIVTVITIAEAFGKKSELYDFISRLGIDIGFTGLMGIVIIISIIVSLYCHWPKVKAVIKTSDVDIIVECCDILKQDGLKVIHATDTFDIEKVKRHSVFDQFIRYCDSIGYDLKTAIQTSLDGKEVVNRFTPESFKRYALGTVCDIQIDNRNTKYQSGKLDVFGLVAFTHLNVEQKTVELSFDEYREFIKTMWKNLSDPRVKADNDVMNVTIMGNRFIDLPVSYNLTQKIGFMLETFFEASKENKCCRTLRICIGKDDAADVDFANIGTIIKYVEGRSCYGSI
jgi:hypothetical protein